MTTTGTPRTYTRPSRPTPQTLPDTTGQPTRIPAPRTPEPPTSRNAEQRTPMTGHKGDRTAVPTAIAPNDGRVRLMLALSNAWLVPGRVPVLLRDAWFREGWSGTTLVAPAGDDREVGVAVTTWADLGGPVERVDDPVAAVGYCVGVIAFIGDLDPLVMAVYDQAHLLGVPTAVAHHGRYPWPLGTPQRESDAPWPAKPVVVRWAVGGHTAYDGRRRQKQGRSDGW